MSLKSIIRQDIQKCEFYDLIDSIKRTIQSVHKFITEWMPEYGYGSFNQAQTDVQWTPKTGPMVNTDQECLWRSVKQEVLIYSNLTPYPSCTKNSSLTLISTTTISYTSHSTMQRLGLFTLLEPFPRSHKIPYFLPLMV